jgi:hypothetical protein
MVSARQGCVACDAATKGQSEKDSTASLQEARFRARDGQDGPPHRNIVPAGAFGPHAGRDPPDHPRRDRLTADDGARGPPSRPVPQGPHPSRKDQSCNTPTASRSARASNFALDGTTDPFHVAPTRSCGCFPMMERTASIVCATSATAMSASCGRANSVLAWPRPSVEAAPRERGPPWCQPACGGSAAGTVISPSASGSGLSGHRSRLVNRGYSTASPQARPDFRNTPCPRARRRSKLPIQPPRRRLRRRLPISRSGTVCRLPSCGRSSAALARASAQRSSARFARAWRAAEAGKGCSTRRAGQALPVVPESVGRWQYTSGMNVPFLPSARAALP